MHRRVACLALAKCPWTSSSCCSTIIIKSFFNNPTFSLLDFTSVRLTSQTRIYSITQQFTAQKSHKYKQGIYRGVFKLQVHWNWYESIWSYNYFLILDLVSLVLLESLFQHNLSVNSNGLR